MGTPAAIIDQQFFGKQDACVAKARGRGNNNSEGGLPHLLASLLAAPTALVALPPRGAKAPHFSWAKDGEVIIQITGVGPSGKTFIPQ